MCNFLSALILQSGEVFCLPEYTDSHEDLIDYLGYESKLPSAYANFVRVEYINSNSNFNSDSNFMVDQDVLPYWYNKDIEFRAIERLKTKIDNMTIKENKHILIGGCYIIPKHIEVKRIVGSRIINLNGNVDFIFNSKVDFINGTVSEIKDSSVYEVGTTGNVATLIDSSCFKNMGKINLIRGFSTVHSNFGSVEIIKNYSRVNLNGMHGIHKSYHFFQC